MRQQTSEQTNRLFTLGRRRQRAHAHACAVNTGTTATLCSDIRQRIRNCCFCQFRFISSLRQRRCANAARQHAIRQRSRACLAGWIAATARIEVDVDIKNRNRVVLDEVHARAIGQGPMLDIERCLRAAGEKEKA